MLLDSLVVGSTLESALYAFLRDSYFLPTSTGPMFYEKLDTMAEGGIRKDYTWSRLQTMLALSGKLLNYNEINNITISEGNIKVSSSSGPCRYDFQLCELFDTTGLSLENKIREQKRSKYLVYDDFEISQIGGKHAFLEPKISDDILAAKIHFYVSDRVDGAKYVTDCVAESTLDKDKLNDIEYSDSMTRFAVLRYLESIGIFGNFMNMQKCGLPKYRRPKVVHKKRLVREIEQTQYEDTERVKILNLSMKEIIDEFGTARS